MGFHCVRPYILFYIHGPAILHLFLFELRKYHKIMQTAICSQKLIGSLADLAEHICQIKRRSGGNFFLKRANEHFFISGRSN